MLDFLALAIGLALLVRGADTLVEGALRLAVRHQLSPAFVGLTLLAIGTSLPEVAASGLASWRGYPTLALGNVVGSNICNIALVLGVASLIRPLRVFPDTVRREVPVLLAATLFVGALAWDGVLATHEGWILVALLSGLAVFVSRDRATAPEAAEVDDTGPEWRDWVRVLVGFAMVTGGAEALVRGAVGLAQGFGVSEGLIGLSVVAFGTSLPELATSVAAARRGQADLSVGNVVGSNIFNTLGVLGVSAAIRPIPVEGTALSVELPVMAVLTVLLWPVLWTRLRISRGEGGLLLGCYGLYVAYLFYTVTA